MKKLLAVVAAVAALSLGLTSVAKAGVTEVGCVPDAFQLRLDDDTIVGTLTVACISANMLMMTFLVFSPYILLEVNGFVEDDETCSGVEVTRRGNVKVGMFPKSMVFSKQEGETMATLTFDIYGFGFAPGDFACGAGHADLRNLEPPPPVDEAWADNGVGGTILFDDPLDGSNPSGATHFIIEIIPFNTD